MWNSWLRLLHITGASGWRSYGRWSLSRDVAPCMSPAAKRADFPEPLALTCGKQWVSLSRGPPYRAGVSTDDCVFFHSRKYWTVTVYEHCAEESKYDLEKETHAPWPLTLVASTILTTAHSSACTQLLSSLGFAKLLRGKICLVQTFSVVNFWEKNQKLKIHFSGVHPLINLHNYIRSIQNVKLLRILRT